MAVLSLRVRRRTAPTFTASTPVAIGLDPKKVYTINGKQQKGATAQDLHLRVPVRRWRREDR
jgi:hypothetical protein